MMSLVIQSLTKVSGRLGLGGAWINPQCHRCREAMTSLDLLSQMRTSSATADNSEDNRAIMQLINTKLAKPPEDLIRLFDHGATYKIMVAAIRKVEFSKSSSKSSLNNSGILLPENCEDSKVVFSRYQDHQDTSPSKNHGYLGGFEANQISPGGGTS